ncbi:DNA methyltransferase [Halorussus caseinilyticus]|uniref:Type II methyltransferase n=1 Tax=Halorussus caseinilyticus TaxID=3034025 RepID=A0ABD5WLT1_9EURY
MNRQQKAEKGHYLEEGVEIYPGDVAECYEDWETPVTIISDGAYGTGLFPDEPDEIDAVPEWYENHIKAWSEHATPQTTLWFWNTEEGWAEVHPYLKKHGWEYRGCNIWNKGMGHIAGNSNTKKLLKFPQVTEVCVQYVREAEFEGPDGEEMDMQEWVINEWSRSGLTQQEANDACGVADAASRKYLTKGNLWYYPPPKRMEAMAEYANEHGDPAGKPYFAPDGENPVDAEDWKKYRAKFDLDAGITNVWEEGQVNGSERVLEGTKAKHINQKPLRLMRRIIKASTDPGDIVWEPFGGLCTGAVAAKQLGRKCRSAEIVDEFYDAATERLATTELNSEARRCTIGRADGLRNV